MSPFEALKESIQSRRAPPLRYVSHKQAVQDYQWLVVRDTLGRLGFCSHDASVLAGSVKGSPRERLDKLIQQKHVFAPRKRRTRKYW